MAKTMFDPAQALGKRIVGMSQQGVCEFASKLCGCIEAQVGSQSGTVAEVSARSGRNSSCTIETETPLADGSYEAQIVVESIHPISFLLN